MMLTIHPSPSQELNYTLGSQNRKWFKIIIFHCFYCIFQSNQHRLGKHKRLLSKTNKPTPDFWTVSNRYWITVLMLQNSSDKLVTTLLKRMWASEWNITEECWSADSFNYFSIIAGLKVVAYYDIFIIRHALWTTTLIRSHKKKKQYLKSNDTLFTLKQCLFTNTQRKSKE